MDALKPELFSRTKSVQVFAPKPFKVQKQIESKWWWPFCRSSFW